MKNETDIHNDRIISMNAPERIMIRDTDTGRKLRERISSLKELLYAYRSGLIVENPHALR